jgi:hypothetical protein
MNEVERPDDRDRHSRLLGVKLRALVSDHLGGTDHVAGIEAEGIPRGAALTVGETAWVLVEGPAARSLGPALAWAVRHRATSLNVIADSDTGLLARRAAQLAFPTSIWFAHDRTLLPAVVETRAAPPEPSADHLALTEVIVAAGATPNVEHGVVFGEVFGLEVCRVVDEPTVGHIAELGEIDVTVIAGGVDTDGVLLEVGVGANDREAFRLLHGDMPTVEALATVVEAVTAHRSPQAPQHPLNRLGQERYLRWQLEQDPGLVDMVRVVPAAPPVPRPNLKDPIPCVAVGTDAGGMESAIVCSVGVDVDLVGFVADVQSHDDRPVIVVLRERDRVAITDDLLALLARPVRVRTV